MMERDDNSCLRQMVNYLMVNTAHLVDLGLYHGIMGHLLFFIRYARFTGDTLYEDFAEHLLNDIYEDIHDEMPINLENGLSGIAWGINDLFRSGILEGDIDAILEDVDRRILSCDLYRMTDLSFHRGVAGIVFYIVTRLSGYIGSVFDEEYVGRIKTLLRDKDFSGVNDLPLFWNELCQDFLQGKEVGRYDLHEFIDLDVSVEEERNWVSLPVGLERGLVGLLYAKLASGEILEEDKNTPVLKTGANDLYIVDQESRGASYGIGSYIKLLLDSLRNTRWSIVVIHVQITDSFTFSIKQTDDVQHIYVGQNRLSKNPLIKERYNRNIAFLLIPYLRASQAPILHFNYIRMSGMASLFKQYLQNPRLALTVHYASWSFDYLGNRSAFLSALEQSDSRLLKNLGRDRKMFDVCDGVIAVSEHSMRDLKLIYGMTPPQVTFISHAIADSAQEASLKERNRLRRKYGFGEDETILLYAGRLDSGKGAYTLAQSFEELLPDYPHLRLVLCGDGAYNRVFQRVKECWGKITFTGFVGKEALGELYTLSDIGVAPSFYEEFGYVALEMMMHRLPVVAGDSSGIKEVVGDTGLLVELDSNAPDENRERLKKAIRRLLDNPDLRKECAVRGRQRYLERFQLSLFRERMIHFYHELG